MKEGLHFEDGELLYYKHGHRYHAGVIEVDGDIYYIGSKGKAVKGQHIVHSEMTNGILKRGTYTFGEDYKLVKGSYKAPKKQKRRGKSARKFFRNKKLMAVCTAALILLLLCGTALLATDNPVFSPDSTPGIPQENVTVELPTFDSPVLLCSATAKQEYDGQLELKDIVQYGNPYRPFLFEYRLEGASGILKLSEHANLANSQEYVLDSESTYIAIDNLKTGTDYYYLVTVNGSEYPGTFQTAESTRFVNIPGLVNTRDIGGRSNLDGKVVKQGLLIRGVELDGLVNAPYFIPNDAIEGVQGTFGFVCDLDLRAPSIFSGKYTSRLGQEVAHKFYNSPMYGEIFNYGYHDSLRNIFKDLADPEKYPMYLHCTWGTDRTGTIIFLLQGILNMSEDDMVREYKLTGFTNPSIINKSNMDVIISGLEQYAGNTLQEKIITYLTAEIGVTDEEIESIRSIFLE